MDFRAALLLVLLPVAALSANAEYTVQSSDVTSLVGSGFSYPPGASASRAALAPKINEFGEVALWEFMINAKKNSTFKNTLLTFTPNITDVFTYDVCAETTSSYPAPPSGVQVGLFDNSFAIIPISPNIGTIPFFGFAYEFLFLDDDGYITFGEPVFGGGLCLGGFFSVPTAGAFFSDLDPSHPKTKIFVDQNEEEGYLSFTFLKVRCSALFCPKGAGRKPQSFQIVVYKSGVIQFYYKSPLKSNRAGIVGLSPGGTLQIPEPVDFDLAESCSA